MRGACNHNYLRYSSWHHTGVLFLSPFSPGGGAGLMGAFNSMVWSNSVVRRVDYG